MPLMQKPQPQSELQPKAKALYDAVLELLNENADINTLTVSDITKRAGIGKGTAYEYFKCKEEIIAGAIVYDAEKQGMESWERLEAISGFEDKIRYCFRWVVECVQEQRAFARFMFLSAHTGSVRDDVMKKMQSMHQECAKNESLGPMGILRGLCEYGRKEGYIRPELPAEAATYLLLGSLTSLVMYLGKENQSEDFKPEKMQEDLCGAFLRAVK